MNARHCRGARDAKRQDTDFHTGRAAILEIFEQLTWCCSSVLLFMFLRNLSMLSVVLNDRDVLTPRAHALTHTHSRVASGLADRLPDSIRLFSSSSDLVGN